MLQRGVCLKCRPDYRNAADTGILRRADGKWCSTCPGCGGEQAYTRKDHAKQSQRQGWKCRKCVAAAKGFNKNRRVGDRQRIFNKVKAAARNRGLAWELTIDDLFASYDGTCAMTGWPISLAYAEPTASVDRIDNAKGYVPGNIQWVHAMVNMSRGKYPLDDFVRMCRAVANKTKW